MYTVHIGKYDRSGHSMGIEIPEAEVRRLRDAWAMQGHHIYVEAEVIEVDSSLAVVLTPSATRGSLLTGKPNKGRHRVFFRHHQCRGLSRASSFGLTEVKARTGTHREARCLIIPLPDPTQARAVRHRSPKGTPARAVASDPCLDVLAQVGEKTYQLAVPASKVLELIQEYGK